MMDGERPYGDEICDLVSEIVIVIVIVTMTVMKR